MSDRAREVVFLGLWPRVAPERLNGREVWTLNDWYRVFPWLTKPARVYQVHEGWSGEQFDKTRFSPDWRDRYNWSGAEVVTLSDFGLRRQRVLDKATLRMEHGSGFFGSTFAYMFADAITEGVGSIELVGVRLKCKDEYARQVPSVLLNIEAARGRGIQVTCEFERSWRGKGAVPGEYRPEWISTGSDGSGYMQRMYGAVD